MTITANMLADLHHLAIAIAPELARRPLYVEPASTFAGLPVFASCLGWAHDKSVTDWCLADALGSQWRGPGPVVALDGKAIAKGCEPGEFNRCVRSVLVHELAHVLPPPPPAKKDLPDTPELRELQRRVMARQVATSDEPAIDQANHDAAFARRCIHLYVRAAAIGVDVALAGLFGPRPYGSREEFFLPLVISEALAMRAETFATIEATPPPAAFLELWQADVDRYLHFRGTQ